MAKFKDGQRIDDFNAEKLTPTKLFYPKSWLEAVGEFDEGTGTKCAEPLLTIGCQSLLELRHGRP